MEGAGTGDDADCNGRHGGTTGGFERASVEAEAEYYRGVYDACRWLSERPSRCMEMAVSFETMRMYREESPGWVWPDREIKTLPLGYPAQQTPAP